MCGIVAVVATEEFTKENPVQVLALTMLHELESRGYDSAGIAGFTPGGNIDLRRAVGNIDQLAKVCADQPITGRTIIGHTRWATNGKVTEQNAHPHVCGRVAVVHNGRIENAEQLRAELVSRGHTFVSETDTEVVAVMINEALQCNFSIREAISMTLSAIQGTYAFVFMIQGMEDVLFATCQHKSLVIGQHPLAVLVASEASALFGFNEATYLQDGDIAEISANKVIFYDQNWERVKRTPTPIDEENPRVVSVTGNHSHDMYREIYEQPETILRTWQSFLNNEGLVEISQNTFSKFPLSIVACGSAYNAGIVAKFWFERLAGIPVTCEIASEVPFRILSPQFGDVALFVSQSGNTEDTLVALEYFKLRGRTVGLVNVKESQVARRAHKVFYTLAGRENSVAATKTFTAQLTALLALSGGACVSSNGSDHPHRKSLSEAMGFLLGAIESVLTGWTANEIMDATEPFGIATTALYIGRGQAYGLALEGALKMKEVSYISAQACPGGELKHGTLALVDKQTPVVVIAPPDPKTFPKIAQDVREIASRGGRIILFSDKAGCDELKDLVWKAIPLPSVHELVAPILYAIPLQLLAYYTSVERGLNPDRPRNLAKQVTV